MSRMADAEALSEYRNHDGATQNLQPQTMNPAEYVIPSDIVDQCIDHLHSDLPALCKCSLVCKAWLPRCRHHLFKTVTLYPGSISRFFDLLHTPDTILPSIRTFSLNQTTLVSTDDNVSHTLPEYLRYKFGPTILVNLHSLTGLCLSLVHFKSFSELAAQIGELPYLERLVIKASIWERGDAFVGGQGQACPPQHLLPAPTRTIPANLRCVRLRNCPKGDIFQWLLASDRLPRITTFDVDDTWAGPEVGALMLRLYAALAPHLQVLFLHPPPSNGSYDLRTFSSLHTLRIMGRRSPRVGSAGWIIPVLQRLPPCLVVLEFWVSINMLSQWDWEQTGQALENLHELQRVRFVWDRRIERTEEFLRPRLPGLAARGLLEVASMPQLGDLEFEFEG